MHAYIVFAHPTGKSFKGVFLAESMKRIFRNDRLQPSSGVAHCEVAILSGGADAQTAPEVRARNLATAYRLGRNFLTESIS